jgi:hypothetical protein
MNANFSRGREKEFASWKLPAKGQKKRRCRLPEKKKSEKEKEKKRERNLFAPLAGFDEGFLFSFALFFLFLRLLFTHTPPTNHSSTKQPPLS